jgi:hypothetical protein
MPLIPRETYHQLSKRKNWPAKNAGVMVVFCVVFVVAAGLSSLFIYRKILARRAAKARLHG